MCFAPVTKQLYQRAGGGVPQVALSVIHQSSIHTVWSCPGLHGSGSLEVLPGLTQHSTWCCQKTDKHTHNHILVYWQFRDCTALNVFWPCCTSQFNLAIVRKKRHYPRNVNITQVTHRPNWIITKLSFILKSNIMAKNKSHTYPACCWDGILCALSVNLLHFCAIADSCRDTS